MQVRQALRLAAYALVGAAVFGTHPHAAQAIEKIKVSMAATSVNYAPYLVAVEKGYFKDEGFDVAIVKAGGGTATPALISGSLDFSTSGSAAVSAIMRGAPLRVIFYPWGRIDYQIWATKPDIKTVEDLKGKQIGIISRGDTQEVAIRIVLARHGMDPNGVGYTPLGFGGGRMAAISSGSLPAAVLAPVDVGRLKKAGKLGNAHLVFDTHDTVKMPLTGTAVSVAMLERNPDRVKRFIRAVAKGLAYTGTYRGATVDMLLKYNPKTARETIMETYEGTLSGRTEDGSISEELQSQEATSRAEVIRLAKNKIPPLDKIYDFRIAKAVGKELAAAHWKPTR
jgi:ABC-type nitrate/sulfonate/bicarbonate transport system substrate-binding protein